MTVSNSSKPNDPKQYIPLTEDHKMKVVCKEIPKTLTLGQLFKQIFMPILYVKTEDSQKKNIWINVSSVAKNLGVSRIAARKLIKNRGIAGLKNEASNRLSYLEIEKKFVDGADSIKKGNLLKLSTKTIRKVHTMASKMPKQARARVKVDGYTFRVIKDDAGKIDIAAKVMQLGQGSFKVVSKYVTLATAKTFALMKAKVQKKPTISLTRATQAIRAEGAILKAIHEKKAGTTPLVGLQSKPHAVYTIQTSRPDVREKIGVMEADLYDGGDLYKIVKDPAKLKKLTIQQQLDICGQLAEGCETLHDMGLVHRDIKPDNIMLKLDEDGKVKEASIIDFGLSIIVDKNKFESDAVDSSDKEYFHYDEQFQEAWTPPYVASGDLKTSRQKDATERGELRYKQDIFALGRTFIEVFLGEKREHFSMGARAVIDVDHEGIKSDLEKLNVPADVIKMLIRAVGLEPLERPTAKEMLEAIKRALQPEVIAAE